MFHDCRNSSQRNVTDPMNRSQGQQLFIKDPKELSVGQTAPNNPVHVWREEQLRPLYNFWEEPGCALDMRHAYFGHQIHDPSASYDPNQAVHLGDQHQWKTVPAVHQASGPESCAAVSHGPLSGCSETRFGNNQTKPGWLSSGGSFLGCMCHVNSFGRCNSDASTSMSVVGSFVQAVTHMGFPCTQACDDWQVGQLEDANVKVNHKDTSNAEAGSFGEAEALVGPSCVQTNNGYSVGVQGASTNVYFDNISSLGREAASVNNAHPPVTEESFAETKALMPCDRYRVGSADAANHDVHPDNESSVTSIAFTDISEAAAAAARNGVTRASQSCNGVSSASQSCDGVSSASQSCNGVSSASQSCNRVSRASRSSPCFQARTNRALQALSPFHSNHGRGSHVGHARGIDSYSPLQADTSNGLPEPYSPSLFEADDPLSSEIGPTSINTGVCSPEESESVYSPNDSISPYSSSEYQTDEFDKIACDATGMFEVLMACSPNPSMKSFKDDSDDEMEDTEGCFVDKENVLTGEDTSDYLVKKPREGKLVPNSDRALCGREETTVRCPQQPQSSLSTVDRKVIVSLTQLRKLFGKRCKTDDCLAVLTFFQETEIKGCVVEFHWKCAAGHQGVWATDNTESHVHGFISGADTSQ